MIVSQLFEAEPINEFFGRKSTAHQLLLNRGWEPTTVPREYKHPDAPGYSIDLDMDYSYNNGEGPFTVFRGSRKIGQFARPPYASHLNLHKPAGQSVNMLN